MVRTDRTCILVPDPCRTLMDSVYQILDAGLFLSIPYLLFRLFKAIRHGVTKDQAVVCLNCGHEAPPVIQSSGHRVVEAVMWLMLIIPGLLYSMWRYSTRKQVCVSCGALELVKASSPGVHVWQGGKHALPDQDHG